MEICVEVPCSDPCLTQAAPGPCVQLPTPCSIQPGSAPHHPQQSFSSHWAGSSRMLLQLGVWKRRLSSPWAAESNPFPGFSRTEIEVYCSKDIHGSLRGCLQPRELFAGVQCGTRWVGWEREEGALVLLGITPGTASTPKQELSCFQPLFPCCWFGLKRNLISS